MNTLLLTLLMVGSSWAIEDVQVHLGNGKVLPKATVVVKNGIISRLGTNLKLDKKTKRISGAGKILTPGFIEPISQIGLTEVSAVASTNDYSISGSSFAAGFRAAEGFNPRSSRIALNRNEGVTGIIVTPAGSVISGSAHYAELTGTMSSRPNPKSPAAIFGSVTTRANRSVGGSRGALWLNLREFISEARFYQKNKNAIARGLSSPLEHSPVHLEAIQPVLNKKLPLVLEAHRASDILTAIEFARSERIQLIIKGGSEAWLVSKELKKARIPVLLKPSGQHPWGFEAISSRDDIATRLHQAGVQIILSAGGWAQNARRIRQEAGIAVSYGLPYNAAMKAITQAPAKVFGLDKEVGTIERGKRANMVLWSGDPFELQSTVEALWIRGALQNLEDRQIQLANRYKK